MHQDQSYDPEAVTCVHQTPVFINQPDGTIRAYYPGEDWYVEGADRTEAIAKLHDETDRRMADPAYRVQHFELAQQHLRGEAVTPGFEVTAISQEDYRQRTNQLGDQLRRLGD
jgi:hypothetical protein